MYYWEGEENQNENGLDKGTVPVYFKLTTQHFGERYGNIIPNKVQFSREQNVKTDLTVKLNRDGNEDGSQTEEITILAEQAERKRRVDRRRSSTMQIELEGQYGARTDLNISTEKPSTSTPKIKEIAFDYLMDSKKPD